jgi:sphingomyelin phosphodiesterase
LIIYFPTYRLVVDHETWIMNLKEANLYDFPVYYKLYSARSAYNMKALRPSDWDEYINTLADDADKFDLYYK